MTASIATLDRRISRAVEAGKGMRLEAGDIDLLVTHGILPVIHAASADYLKEQARCRDMRRRSIGAENTGSTGTESETEPSGLRTLPSSGTIPARDVSEARRRGRRPRTKQP